MALRSSHKIAAGAAVLLLALATLLLVVQGMAPGPLPSPSPLPKGPRTFSASFTSLEGSVSVKRVGSFDWSNADMKTVLQRGDNVRTGANGTAEIRFFDGTLVKARPDSLITIEETSEDPFTRRRKVAWHVSSGEVNFETLPQRVLPGTTEMSTPTARATADAASQGGVRVTPDGESDFRLFSGSTQVETRSGQRVVVLANEGIKIDAAGAAAPKRSLPGAPVLSAPPDDAEFEYPDPEEASTVLAWQPVEAAEGYRVTVALSPSFAQTVLDRSGVKMPSLEVKALKGGVYFWRVAALTPGGLEGPTSPVAHFTVVADAAGAPPRLVANLEVRQNVLRVTGETVPGAKVTINDIPVRVAADGRFAEFLTLDRPGRQTVTVRSVSRSGGVAEQSRAVEARF